MTMTKRVNVRANVAIRNINPPIYGTCNNIIMTTGDILKCLCRRAQVEEILPDGRTVKLNMSNYFTDNGAGLSASTAVEKKNANEPTITLVTNETTDTVEDSCAEISSVENTETNEIDAVEEAASIDEDVVDVAAESVDAVEETPVEEEHHEDENVEVEVVEDAVDTTVDSEDTTEVTAETEEVHADEEKTATKKSSRKKKSNK